MTCTCSHIALTHRYDTATRSNSGKCLALGCGCRGFASDERAENPLGIRDSGVSAWENDLDETTPRRCANTVGPRGRRPLPTKAE